MKVPDVPRMSSRGMSPRSGLKIAVSRGMQHERLPSKRGWGTNLITPSLVTANIAMSIDEYNYTEAPSEPGAVRRQDLSHEGELEWGHVGG